MNIGLLTLTFVAVNLDFFIMLLFLLKLFPLSKVIIGYLLGNIILLSLSFFAGKLLESFLPEWILGILGVIPIYLALKGDADEEADVKSKSPIIVVLVTYLSVCAGCNLSIFLPVLLGETFPVFLETLFYIGFLTVVIVLLLKLIEKNELVQLVIDKYGEILMKICYIVIGIYVMFDSGLIKHVFNFFMSVL